MVTTKRFGDGGDSDPCVTSAIRAYQAADTQDWSASIGQMGRKLEIEAGDLPNRLAGSLLDQRLVLVLGAGVSCSCGLPGWGPLVAAVVSALLSQSEIHTSEAESVLSSLLFSDNPLALAQAVTAMASTDAVNFEVGHQLSRHRISRSSLLMAVGEVLELQHSKARRRRSRRRPVVVITFNYDTLLEEELARRELPVTVLGRGATMSDLDSSAVNVWHVHGLISDRHVPVAGEAEIVLTEANYGHAYLHAQFDPLTALLVDARMPLFVGFSFQDAYVRQLLLRASLDAGQPIAAGIVPRVSLIDKSKIAAATVEQLRSLYDAQGERSHNKRAGLHRRTHIRNEAMFSIPNWFARWVLYSIGVEWWQVDSFEDVSPALQDLIPA